MKKKSTQHVLSDEESHQLKESQGNYQSYLLNNYKNNENIPYPIGHGWCLTNGQSVLSSKSPLFFLISLICLSLQSPLVLSLFIFKEFCILILDKCVPICHTFPPLPPEFRQMMETLADLTTDEEHDSSSKESDDSSVCDNDSDFSDTESSDEKVQGIIKFSLKCLFVFDDINQRGHKVSFFFVLSTKTSFLKS